MIPLNIKCIIAATLIAVLTLPLAACSDSSENATTAPVSSQNDGVIETSETTSRLERNNESFAESPTFQSITTIGSLQIDGKTPFSISPNGKYALTGCWELYENVSGDFSEWRKIELSEFELPDQPSESFFFSSTPFQRDELAWSHDGNKFAIGMYVLGATGGAFDTADIYVVDISNQTISNLTDVPGEENIGRISDDTAELYADYAPAFSADGKIIYFARFGRGFGRSVSGIYAVPSVGGETEVVIQKSDAIQRNDRDDILPRLFQRDDILTYVCIPVYRERIRGIYQYTNNTETLLYSFTEEVGTIEILDVSTDGRRIIFAERLKMTEQGDMPDDEYLTQRRNTVYLLDLEESEQPTVLAPISDGYILNACFSPSGNEIMQVEHERGLRNHIFIKNDNSVLASDVSDTNQNYAQRGVQWFVARTTPLYWLENGYVFVDLFGVETMLIKIETN